MKQSLFNNFIPVCGPRVLGYNAFNRRFALIPQETAKYLQETELDTQALSAIAERSPELISGGFIIPSDIDELELIDSDLIEIDKKTDMAELHINPTLDCNFRCWYCYEEHQKDSEMSERVLESVKCYLDKNVKAPLSHFRLSFFGGEPLLKFDTICRKLILYVENLCKQRNIRLHLSFTTNSYLLTPEIADFLSRYNCGMQITLDGHREFHNRVRFASGGIGSYDRIISNIAMLANSGISVVLRINYTLGNIDSVGDIITDLTNEQIASPNNIQVDFQRVWQDMHTGGEEKVKRLIGKFTKHLKETGMHYSIPDLHNPRLSSCYGDKANYVCINYNGDFFKCTARDFKRERRSGYLAQDGTLIWEPGRKEAWERAKFSRQVCRICRIAPICLGGCRQRGLESPDDGSCPLGYDEARKDELILQRFEHQYLNA